MSIVMCALLMNLAFAADDQSAEGFWRRGQQIESASSLNEMGLFNLNGENEYGTPYTLHIKSIEQLVQRNMSPEYYAYYCGLAYSARIDDSDKLHKELVFVPFFHSLAERGQVTKDHFLKFDFLDALLNCYPVGRLLLAASCYAGANPNQQDRHTDHSYLSEVLRKKDHALAGILLAHGATQRPEDLKLASTNLNTVYLLLHYGANIKEQHKQTDLILTFCFNPESDIRCMQLFLEDIGPQDKNEKLVGRPRDLLFSRNKFEIADWQNRVALLLANASYDIDEVFAKVPVPEGIEEDRFHAFQCAFILDQGLKQKRLAREPQHKRRKL